MESLSTLRRLANIISDSVTTMERVYAQSGMSLPSLDEPFDPKDPAEALRQDPEVSNAVKNVVAAAAQISATVCDPMRVAVNTSHAFHISSCLLAASDLNVVEILREAGPKVQNLRHVRDVDPSLMARILRLLATHHIFREVSPGVFANNRVSSTLDKGKPSSELYANRGERLTGSSGVAALAEHTADIVGKSGVYLSDSLLNPNKPIPFNIAYQTEQMMFNWFQRPENSYNVSRFAVAMQGTAATEPADLIFQDLAPAIEISKGYWKANFPAHVDNNMVDFHGHSGASRPTAESPLLPNWGAATRPLSIRSDNARLAGGVERTLEGFCDVFERSGWKLVEVHHCPGSQCSHLVAAVA
ncbi:hypothetical protein B0H13DRAFT_2099729 [Mycena leptocephala]|nr:hypothetical protein B0H13DRAFT_2099729 [Mycena leptocephala]